MASKYKKLKNHEAVLNAPEMYIGSVRREPRKEWHLVKKEDTLKAVLKKTDIPIGMIHIFKEVLSNVADNCVRSREEGIDPEECIIKIRKNRITVKSFGSPITIKINKEYGQMVPKYIFSDMHSGSNFTAKRTGGGRHGLGGKAANIMSTEFSIDCKNSDMHRRYQMTWYDNLFKEGEEIYDKNYEDGEKSVTISYILDMKRFGYEKNENYSSEAIEIFKWVAACLSFTAKIPVTFNREVMNFKDIKKFGMMYIEGNELGKHIIHKEEGNLEMIAIDTPNKGVQLGFTNSIINSSGGTHVNGSLHALTGDILSDKKAATKESLTVRDIKNHIILIISINIENPEWGNGQTKTKLTGPQIKPKIDQKTIEKLKKWSLAKMLEASIQAKMVDKMLKSTEGKARRIRNVKGEEANWAGDSTKWVDAVLSALEGDSASQYESIMLNHLEEGRDKYGVIELRGKIKNVMKSTEMKSLKNKEVFEIIRRLNAKPNIDYTVESNYKTLRYGRFRIMTDPDFDGAHIGGLLIALFYEFFPSLLQRNDFLYAWFRPVIQTNKGKTIRRFYTEGEYYDWVEETPDYKKWEHRYFKGLGSCTPEDIEADCKDPREVLLKYDKRTANKIKIAFGKPDENDKDLRKDWMNDWDPTAKEYLGEDSLRISKFIDWYVREYSNDTLARNLPGFDGLTRVRRKVIHTTFREWGRQCNSKKKLKIDPNFAGDVGGFTNYHHGNSVQKVVICMGQSFVGSNNIPLFEGFGSFGSIVKGGKAAAAPRYLAVRANHIVACIFRPEDDKCLQMTEDEGKMIEPAHYAPIIPLALINGIDGIAMGWSSTIHAYHPMEVINAIESLIKGKKIHELVPWYRGFEGQINLKDGYMISKGIVKNIKEKTCTVICLPVGLWQRKYKKTLDLMIDNGNLKDYESKCTATKTEFRLKGISFLNEKGGLRDYNLDDLGLVVKKKVSNMTMISPEGKVVKFDNVVDLIKAFYAYRLPIYSKRKAIMLEDLRDEIQLLGNRKAYIAAILSGKLKVSPLPGEELEEETVLKDIKKLGLNPAFYIKRKIESEEKEEKEEDEGPKVGKKKGISLVVDREKSKQGISKLDVQITNLEERYRELEKIKIEDMWLSDLTDLKKEYVKVYGDDRRVVML